MVGPLLPKASVWSLGLGLFLTALWAVLSAVRSDVAIAVVFWDLCNTFSVEGFFWFWTPGSDSKTRRNPGLIAFDPFGVAGGIIAESGRAQQALGVGVTPQGVSLGGMHEKG